MKVRILVGAVVFLWMVLGNGAYANSDITLLVQNHLKVPLRYQQSECVLARCPRSFPASLKHGDVVQPVVARSLHGDGGALRLDYGSTVGSCRFVAQTARRKDGFCEAPVARAFPINSTGIKCVIVKRWQDKNCDLTVDVIVLPGD